MEAAKIVNAENIHILIELNGYLEGSRLKIVAQQPCPYQVHYFAQPATMGAPYIQGFIGDRIITPVEAAPFYTETLILLPRCFLSTSHSFSDGRVLEWSRHQGRDRSTLDIPTEGSLLCNFNSFFKLNPGVFNPWLKMLMANPNLKMVFRAKWGSPPHCFRKAASAVGVAPDRLHFSGDLSGDSHLKRLHACDLVVDSQFYNGITTSAAVMWTGTPVLGTATEMNSGRCVASFLNAADVPELLARNMEEYEQLGLRLLSTQGRHLLDGIAAKVERARSTSALYRPGFWAASMEAALKIMAELQNLGWRGHVVVADHDSENKRFI